MCGMNNWYVAEINSQTIKSNSILLFCSQFWCQELATTKHFNTFYDVFLVVHIDFGSVLHCVASQLNRIRDASHIVCAQTILCEMTKKKKWKKGRQKLSSINASAHSLRVHHENSRWSSILQLLTYSPSWISFERQMRKKKHHENSHLLSLSRRLFSSCFTLDPEQVWFDAKHTPPNADNLIMHVSLDACSQLKRYEGISSQWMALPNL